MCHWDKGLCIIIDLNTLGKYDNPLPYQIGISCDDQMFLPVKVCLDTHSFALIKTILKIDNWW